MTLFLTAASCWLFAQQKEVNGTVTDSISRVPLDGITVTVSPGNRTDITNVNGRFSFNSTLPLTGTITFSGLGFEKKKLSLAHFRHGETVLLVPKQTLLSDVIITASTTNPYKMISESDIKMRNISNSQEVLRIVPGLFIGQHQGGGKAEQIFLRGFDNDHGTDISLNVDGLPVNMVSHAHGQGYADSHFIIPETIAETSYKKGPYDAEKGDFATTGFVDFHTANTLAADQLKVEAGQFHTYRILGMMNLLGESQKAKNQSWYAASEYRYSDSYFDHPQHFKRFNFFTKYYGQITPRSWLTVSASTLYSKWKASGQIPENAVEAGQVSFYGALDPNEGGLTSRTNANVQFVTGFENHDVLKNQLYYSRYKFDLHTNFTFFLVDSLNGDEIRQREARNLYGYQGSYTHNSYLGRVKVTSNVGLNARLDQTKNSELSHTLNRYTLINPVKLGDITEWSAGAYVNETFRLDERFTLNAGLRFDQLYYQYHNKLAADSTLSGVGIYKANDHIISPKINLYYQVSSKAQLYLFLGKGFHSNDTRVVVSGPDAQRLPAMYSADLGTVLKPFQNLILHAALWSSYLQKEYVYSGDGGTVDFSGRTRRVGFDCSARYQPFHFLYLDADLNYAHGRALDEVRGEDYIPLAPVWSSTGGITYMRKRGLNGSLRYRFLGHRPANEDNSLVAKGYFINDMVLNYTWSGYEIGITVNNLFNVRWKETQFDTLTRLKGEAPVEAIAFTPGTKFASLFHFSYCFK